MNVLFTVSSVYILSAKWPYSVFTSYCIDGNESFTIVMRDLIAPDSPLGGNATVRATVLKKWPMISDTMNQQHTINVSLPSGTDESGPQVYAVIDLFK